MSSSESTGKTRTLLGSSVVHSHNLNNNNIMSQYTAQQETSCGADLDIKSVQTNSHSSTAL